MLLKSLIPRSFMGTLPRGCPGPTGDLGCPQTPRQFRTHLSNKFLIPRLINPLSLPSRYNKCLLNKNLLTRMYMKTINFKPKILNKQWIHTFYALDNIDVKVTFLKDPTASYCNYCDTLFHFVDVDLISQ